MPFEDFLAFENKTSQPDSLESLHKNIREEVNRPIRQKNLETKGAFRRGVESGVDNLQAMGGGAIALAGKALGVKPAQDMGMRIYEKNVEEASLNPSYARFMDLVKNPSLADAKEWAGYTFGSLLPSVAEAGIGAVAGSMVAPGPGTAVGGLAGRTILKKAIGELTERQVAKGIAREVAEQQASRAVLRSVGAKTGAVGATFQMEAGGNFGEAVDTVGIDKASVGSAIATGAGAALLETLGGNIRLVDAVLGAETGRAARQALARGDKNFLVRTFKEITTQAPAEALQEMGQEAFSLVNLAFNDPTFSVFSEENRERLIEAGAAGALGGVGFGTATGLLRKPVATTDTDVNLTEDPLSEYDTPAPTADYDVLNPAPAQQTAQPLSPELQALFDQQPDLQTMSEEAALGEQDGAGDAIATADEGMPAIDELEPPGDIFNELAAQNPDMIPSGISGQPKVAVSGGLSSEEKTAPNGKTYNHITFLAPKNIGNTSTEVLSSVEGLLAEAGKSKFPAIVGGSMDRVSEESRAWYPYIVAKDYVSNPTPANKARLDKELGSLRAKANKSKEEDNALSEMRGVDPSQEAMPSMREEDREELSPVDAAAHQAATSPLNDLNEPSEAQKEKGNYKKGHLRLHGLDISIENPKGSKRSGTSPDGKAWETEMQNHYGYIRGTVGKDKDHLDVFLGENPERAQNVFVVDQVDPDTGNFDEWKAILGAKTFEEAQSIYLANYDDSGPSRIGAITEIPVRKFREMAFSGKGKYPASYGKKFDEIEGKLHNGGQLSSQKGVQDEKARPERTTRNVEASPLQNLAQHSGQNAQSEKSALSQLRGAGNNGSSSANKFFRISESGRRTSVSETSGRQDRQQSGVHARESALGYQERTGTEHEEKSSPYDRRRDQNADGVGRADESSSVDNSLPSKQGNDDRRGGHESSKNQREKVVTLNSGVNIDEIVKLAGNIKAAMPKLIELGRSVLAKGHTAFSKFIAEMKRLLGGAYEKFKGVMQQVFVHAKKTMKDQRGMVGPDIGKLDVSMAPSFAQKKEAAKAEGARWVLAPKGIPGSFASKLAEQAEQKGMLVTDPSQVSEGEIVYISVPGRGRGYNVSRGDYKILPALLDKGAVVRTDNKANAFRDHSKEGEGAIYAALEQKGYVATDKGLFTEWKKAAPAQDLGITLESNEKLISRAKKEMSAGETPRKGTLDRLRIAYQQETDPALKEKLKEAGIAYRAALDAEEGRKAETAKVQQQRIVEAESAKTLQPVKDLPPDDSSSARPPLRTKNYNSLIDEKEEQPPAQKVSKEGVNYDPPRKRDKALEEAAEAVSPKEMTDEKRQANHQKFFEDQKKKDRPKEKGKQSKEEDFEEEIEEFEMDENPVVHSYIDKEDRWFPEDMTRRQKRSTDKDDVLVRQGKQEKSRFDWIKLKNQMAPPFADSGKGPMSEKAIVARQKDMDEFEERYRRSTKESIDLAWEQMGKNKLLSEEAEWTNGRTLSIRGMVKATLQDLSKTFYLRDVLRMIERQDGPLSSLKEFPNSLLELQAYQENMEQGYQHEAAAAEEGDVSPEVHDAARKMAESLNEKDRKQARRLLNDVIVRPEQVLSLLDDYTAFEAQYENTPTSVIQLLFDMKLDMEKLAARQEEIDNSILEGGQWEIIPGRPREINEQNRWLSRYQTLIKDQKAKGKKRQAKNLKISRDERRRLQKRIVEAQYSLFRKHPAERLGQIEPRLKEIAEQNFDVFFDGISEYLKGKDRILNARAIAQNMGKATDSFRWLKAEDKETIVRAMIRAAFFSEGQWKKKSYEEDVVEGAPSTDPRNERRGPSLYPGVAENADLKREINAADFSKDMTYLVDLFYEEKGQIKLVNTGDYADPSKPYVLSGILKEAQEHKALPREIISLIDGKLKAYFTAERSFNMTVSAAKKDPRMMRHVAEAKKKMNDALAEVQKVSGYLKTFSRKFEELRGWMHQNTLKEIIDVALERDLITQEAYTRFKERHDRYGYLTKIRDNMLAHIEKYESLGDKKKVEEIEKLLKQVRDERKGLGLENEAAALPFRIRFIKESFAARNMIDSNFFENLSKDYPDAGMSAAEMYDVYLKNGANITALKNIIAARIDDKHQKQADSRFAYLKERRKKAQKEGDSTEFVGSKGRRVAAAAMAETKAEDIAGSIASAREPASSKKVIRSIVTARMTREQKALYEKVVSGDKAEFYRTADTEMRVIISVAQDIESRLLSTPEEGVPIATIKAESLVATYIEDYFTEAQTEDVFQQSLLERNPEMKVGTLRNIVARKFYGMVAKAFGADLVIVSDPQYRTRYIGKAQDGRSKIVMNVGHPDGIHFPRAFAHEIFHHVVNKVAPHEYAAFKSALFSFESRLDPSLSPEQKAFLRRERNAAWDRVKQAGELHEEEVLSELFAEAITHTQFYEALSKTLAGKGLAGRIASRLINHFVVYKGVIEKDKGAFTWEGRTLVRSSEMNKVYDLMISMLGRAYQSKSVRTEGEKFLTAEARQALSGTWNAIYPPGTKSYKDVMTNIEKGLAWLRDKAIELKPKGIYADLGAEQVEVELMTDMRYKPSQERARVEASIVAKHEKTFDTFVDARLKQIEDRIKADFQSGKIPKHQAEKLLQANTSTRVLEKLHDDFVRKGVSFADAKTMGYPQEVIDAFADFKKESDRIHAELVKFYPELGKVDTHYGQSIRWYRKDGTVLDPDFDWAVNPEFSKLEGSKQFLKEKARDMTTRQIAEKHKLEAKTLDPNQMFLDYVTEATRLIAFREMLTKGANTLGKDRQPLVKTFTNQAQAAREGYFPVDDNATRIFMKMDVPFGYKVRLPDGTLYEEDGVEVLYTTEEGARQQAQRITAFGDGDATVEEAKNHRLAAPGAFTVVRHIMGPDGKMVKTPSGRTFPTRAEAQKYADSLAGRPGKFEIEEKTVKPEQTQVSQIYFSEGIARMLNVVLAKDRIRNGKLLGISGNTVMKLKNAMTSVEFAVSLFHFMTIGQELVASSSTYGLKRRGLKGWIAGFNPAFGKNSAFGQAQQIASLMDMVAKDPSKAKDPAVMKKARELFDTDVDLFELFNEYLGVGGMMHQDSSLRSHAHSLGKMRYRTSPHQAKIENGEVVFESGKFSAKTAMDSFYAVYEKTVKEEASPLFKTLFGKHAQKARAVKNVGVFAGLEATTAWLMEYGIPRVKAAMWAREYSLALDRHREALAAGTITKKKIAIDTMTFIEDRFGEVNWDNMWMKPTAKTALQFLFRSYTWVAGNFATLAKGSLDIARLGWFRLKGEQYELTEKGWWAINAIIAHMLTVSMLTLAYTIGMGGDEEVPTDEGTPWTTRLLFPRYDRTDPESRLYIPSYVSETWKIFSHLGMGGSEVELTKLVSGRFNSLIGQMFDVFRGNDWRGVSITNPDDSMPVAVAKNVWHIFFVAPISVSSVADRWRAKGFEPKGTFFSMMGMTDAPAAAKRSAATNHAFALRRKEFAGKEMSPEDMGEKEALKRAMYAYQKGDRSKLDEMLAEGRISHRQFSNALGKIPLINEKPNPLYLNPLSQALKGLTIEGALEVWEEMSDAEKKKHRAEILAKYGNVIRKKDKTPAEKEKIYDRMKSLGIL